MSSGLWHVLHKLAHFGIAAAMSHQSKDQEKAERLRAALRDNLRRRKAKTKAGASGEADKSAPEQSALGSEITDL